MNSKNNSNNFLVQGAILAAASILVRIIGLIYRIPLNNILGEKGIAYYGVAYDVYSILLLLSSYSMPLAVSKMVSARVALGQYKNTRKILIHAICFSLLCGIAAFAITFFGAGFFARALNFPQSELALKVLSPALIIMSVLGTLRGYFQGFSTMIPTAVSNIFEQIINAFVSVAAAMILFKSAGENATASSAGARGAAGGTLGTVSGAFAALLFMIALTIMFRSVIKRKEAKDKTTAVLRSSEILKVIIFTILPVILSTTIYNIGSLLDTGVFSNLMKVKGIDQDVIETLTGMYTGNYRLIINVPIALASALASSLIPSIVTSMMLRQRKIVIAKIRSSIKLTMIVAFPCAVGIGVLAKPIVNLLFASSTDPDKVALMLMIGVISVVLYSLSTITNSILQGLDKMNLPVRHSAISLGIHAVFLVLMILITDLNIFCVVIADILFALVICILNHISLRRLIGYRQEKMRTFILPFACSAIMGLFTRLAYNLFRLLKFGNTISTILAILIAIVIYVVALFKLNVVSKKELLMLPGGTKMSMVAGKLHLLR